MKNFTKKYFYLSIVNYLIIITTITIKYDLLLGIFLTIISLKYLILLWAIYGLFGIWIKFDFYFNIPFHSIFILIHVSIYIYIEYVLGDKYDKSLNYVLLIPIISLTLYMLYKRVKLKE